MIYHVWGNVLRKHVALVKLCFCGRYPMGLKILFCLSFYWSIFVVNLHLVSDLFCKPQTPSGAQLKYTRRESERAQKRFIRLTKARCNGLQWNSSFLGRREHISRRGHDKSWIEEGRRHLGQPLPRISPRVYPLELEYYFFSLARFCLQGVSKWRTELWLECFMSFLGWAWINSSVLVKSSYLTVFFNEEEVLDFSFHGVQTAKFHSIPWNQSV